MTCITLIVRRSNIKWSREQNAGALTPEGALQGQCRSPDNMKPSAGPFFGTDVGNDDAVKKIVDGSLVGNEYDPETASLLQVKK